MTRLNLNAGIHNLLGSPCKSERIFFLAYQSYQNQSNGNKFRKYRIFKTCYERKTYLFVNELSKSEISTFAKLRISSHDLHIEKGRHR